MPILIDLTSVRNDREQEFYDILRARLAGAGDASTVVVSPVFLTVAEGTRVVGTPGSLTEREAAFEVEFENFMAQAASDECIVASFNTALGFKIEELAKQGLKARFIDIRTLAPSASQRAYRWPEQYVPLETAMSVMEQAIASRTVQTRLTNLRPAMTLIDPRFKKNPSAPTPLDVQGMFGLLVTEAERRGRIIRSGPPNNPVLTLIGHAPTVTGSTAPLPVEEAAAGRQSDRFIQVLRSARLGPFQQVRRAIYAKVAERIEQLGDETVTVRALLDGAVDAVRSEVEESQRVGGEYLVKGTQRLPWSQVRTFIGTLFILRPVLIGSSGPVSADWVGLREAVTGIEDGWMNALDSLLVKELMQSGCVIDVHSDPDLGGALFNSRTNLLPVEDLLGYMITTNQCELSHTTLVLRAE